MYSFADCLCHLLDKTMYTYDSRDSSKSRNDDTEYFEGK